MSKRSPSRRRPAGVPWSACSVRARCSREARSRGRRDLGPRDGATREKQGGRRSGPDAFQLRLNGGSRRCARGRAAPRQGGPWRAERPPSRRTGRRHRVRGRRPEARPGSARRAPCRQHTGSRAIGQEPSAVGCCPSLMSTCMASAAIIAPAAPHHSHAGSVNAAMLTADELAKRHGKRSREGRQHALVNWFAGFYALDRPR